LPCGSPVDPAAVRVFVASAWPLIQEGLDVQRWAREYAERAHLAYG
jgi:hypothetical protein